MSRSLNAVSIVFLGSSSQLGDIALVKNLAAYAIAESTAGIIKTADYWQLSLWLLAGGRVAAVALQYPPPIATRPLATER